MSNCNHDPLFFGVVNSTKLSYKQPTEQERRDALKVTYPVRKKLKVSSKNGVKQDVIDEALGGSILPPASIFPAPVVLPGDELFHDPEYPPQSVQEWVDGDDRNEVTSKHRAIYVVAPPSNSDDVAFVNDWAVPEQVPGKKSSPNTKISKDVYRAQQPQIEDVVGYLQAFYHGIRVRTLKKPKLEFTAWESGEAPKQNRKKHRGSTTPTYIGLSTDSETIRIRSRRSKDGLFSGQLNLDDLLDAAISILPKDAYALILLVHHDLYEGDDDDFCCGRAYGGSRIAVISTARYRPELDATQGVKPEHVWPASHCSRYIGSFFDSKASMVNPKIKGKAAAEHIPNSASAIARAVRASDELPLPSSPSELSAVWLGRVCKTASHELGHCFGIDHCTYYACIMQGTAHLAEDSRQPPYLCPVDLAKVLQATKADKKERYEALIQVCEKWKDDRMFAAFGAWIHSRLTQLEES